MIKQKIRTLIEDKRGANMVEYIILVAVIALIAIAAFRTFEKSVSKKVEQKSNEVGQI
ncbi:MAG: hypothetical protein KF718_30445 [Polyangiaceae bacterium]|nr:hypothetical protein [Polyangiaceae bacterium]